MPLTEERPGLFRGRDSSGRGWFVVDPARDPEPLAAKWRENFASRNEPAVKRAARWAVGVVSYLVLLVLLGFVVAAVQKVPLLYYPGLVVAAAIGLAGLVGAAGTCFSRRAVAADTPTASLRSRRRRPESYRLGNRSHPD
jgi:uncharacterized integral membrane protein